VQRAILAVDRAWDGAKADSKGTGFGLADVFGGRIAEEGSGYSIGLRHRGNLAAMQSIISDFLAKDGGLSHDPILPCHVVNEL
jgi:hypothetical protein